jgi:hypothetical protein
MTQKNRRGFVRQCFGAGASLVAFPYASSPAVESGEVQPPIPEMSEYERILSHTENMHIVGNPRSWSLVSQGLHPFAPERVVVLASGDDSRYGDRCGRDLRRNIDEQIKRAFGHMSGHDTRWFPESKLDSIYWMMDAMAGHYGVPSFFEQSVVGLAGREIIGSTAYCGMGMAHQYQRGGAIPIDNPPFDWWLFLFPQGIDWAALDEEPIFAVICHVAENDYTYKRGSYGAMWPLWVLTKFLGREVTDWSEIAKMGRVDACRCLNKIAAQNLSYKGLRSLEKPL